MPVPTAPMTPSSAVPEASRFAPDVGQRARRAVRADRTRVGADPRERERVLAPEEPLRAHAAGRTALGGELAEQPTPWR